uniref:Uncharacterized protein n=1 Tax=uncultured marine virus TaxID=186617 RepID=A0A0F7L3T7_9VIRU|nr:hypothetical protein [uncultured marine virus]
MSRFKKQTCLGMFLKQDDHKSDRTSLCDKGTPGSVGRPIRMGRRSISCCATNYLNRCGSQSFFGTTQSFTKGCKRKHMN